MASDPGKPGSKDYIRPIGVGWWLQRRRYTLYMIRETTCVAVGGYTLFLLLLVSLAGDEAAFSALVDRLSSPLSVVLHLIALLLLIYHAVTFIQAGPKAIVLYRGDERVPPRLIVGALYAAWLGVSLVIAWFAMGA